MATKTVRKQQQHPQERWGQQSWHKLHQQVSRRKPRRAQAARVSTARKSAQSRSCSDVVSYTPHWLKMFLGPTSLHRHTCVVLLDLTFPPFLLRPDLHRLLPLLCPDAPWALHRPRQTLTPWKMTCATPPRGVTTPTTSPTPSHEKETIAVSATISIRVEKLHHQIRLPNSFMQQSERNASRTRSPRGQSPSGRMSRWPCKD